MSIIPHSAFLKLPSNILLNASLKAIFAKRFAAQFFNSFALHIVLE